MRASRPREPHAVSPTPCCRVCSVKHPAHAPPPLPAPVPASLQALGISQEIVILASVAFSTFSLAANLWGGGLGVLGGTRHKRLCVCPVLPLRRTCALSARLSCCLLPLCRRGDGEEACGAAAGGAAAATCVEGVIEGRQQVHERALMPSCSSPALRVTTLLLRPECASP